MTNLGVRRWFVPNVRLGKVAGHPVRSKVPYRLDHGKTGETGPFSARKIVVTLYNVGL